MDIKIQVLRNIDSLTGLKDSWNAAVSASNNPSVFSTYEWFYAWINNFASDLEIFVVLAWNNDNLVGIMPLHVKGGNKSPSIVCSLSNAHTCKFDIILAKQGGPEILSAMLTELNNELPWVRLDLWYVPEFAKNLTLLKTLPRSLVSGIRTERQMESPYVTIDRAWQDYLVSRDKKVKKNWDYFERKLNKEGKVEVLTITDSSSIDNMLPQAYAIEQASWKGNQGSAIADSSNVASFYYDLAQGMSGHGMFKLHFLLLDDTPIAFDYCLVYKDCYSVLKTGYDPSYSKSSPGRVLRKITLKQIYEENSYKIYDLLGAKDAWKLEWADDSAALLNVQIYSSRPAARLHYLYAKSKDLGKNKLRQHPKLLAAVKAGISRVKAFNGRTN